MNEHVGLPIRYIALVELFTCQGGYTYSPEFNNED